MLNKLDLFGFLNKRQKIKAWKEPLFFLILCEIVFILIIWDTWKMFN